MALPYPTKVVLPFDIATAQDMNERHANDVALANGSGLDNGAVTASKIDSATYTTSEKVIGTWIDGKPIYRRTITGTITETANVRNVRAVFNQPGDMINAYGYFEVGGSQFQLGQVTGNDGLTNIYNFSYLTHTSSGDYNMITRADTARTNEPFQITIEYTKL